MAPLSSQATLSTRPIRFVDSLRSPAGPLAAASLLMLLACWWASAHADETPGSEGEIPTDNDGSAAGAADEESTSTGSGGDASAPGDDDNERDDDTEGRAVAAGDDDVVARPEVVEPDAGAEVASEFVAALRAVHRPPTDPRAVALRVGALTRDALEALNATLAQVSNERDIGALTDQWTSVALREHRRAGLARSLLSTFAARANATFDAIHSGARDSPVARVELFASQHIAYAAERARVTAASEAAVADLAVAYLNERLRLVREVAREDPASDVAAQSAEIAAERQRLEHESGITDSVAQRAVETSERARSERLTAHNAVAQSIADRWEALGPRLDRVVAGRLAEQRAIEAITVRREEFTTSQIRHTAALRSLTGETRAAERQAAADRLLETLMAERHEVRGRAATRRREVQNLEVAAAEVRADVESKARDAEAAVQALAAENLGLAAQLRELEEEELRALEEELGLAELRKNNATSRWRLNEAQVYFYARTIDRVIPHISDERAKDLFRISASNLRDARQNLIERIVGFRVWAEQQLSGDDFLSGQSTEGRLTAIVRPAILLIAALVGLRLMRRVRDPLVLGIVSARAHPRLRRFSRLFLKTGEILHTSGRELVIVTALYVAPAVLPQVPFLHMIATWLFWIALYVLALRVLTVVLLPRTARKPIFLGEPPNEVRLGVDLHDLSADAARLVLSSARLVLLYLVIGRVGLAIVRFIVGPGFIHYWSETLFSAALAALVYAIAWSWRGAVIDQFHKHSGPRGAAASKWAEAHRDRFYSVFVVLVFAVYLLTRTLIRVATQWASGRGPGQTIANFALRKKLERAANETAAVRQVSSRPLPEAYRAVFADRPLTDEPYLISREHELQQVVLALDEWELDPNSYGSVAVVGGPGSGKTTFANEVARHLEPRGQVLRTSIDQRLLTTDAARAWLVETLGFDDCADREALVAAAAAGGRRIVVVDDADCIFLRRVGGFDAMEELLDLVALTDDYIFWVLVFDRQPWNFMHRVRDRRGYFFDVVRLQPFDDQQLGRLIEARSAHVGITPNFERLAGTAERDERQLEVIKTSAGYFRLLADYARGNLRVAMDTWVKSLVVNDDGEVEVSLFVRPDLPGLRAMSDDRMFLLASVVQHRALTPEELAETLDLDLPSCVVLVNLLVEGGLLRHRPDGRLSVSTALFIAATGRLREANLLHLE